MASSGNGRPYQNGARYWGNFTRYAGIGGKREPLIPPGEKLATIDPAVASVLYGERIRWYAQRERAGHLTGLPADVDPQTYAATEYLPALEQKARFARNQKADAPLRRADREALAKAKHSLLVCFEQPALRSVHGLAQISRRNVSQLGRSCPERRRAMGTCSPLARCGAMSWRCRGS